MMNILNNMLPWDGSHLGNHPETRIMYEWRIEGTIYKSISLADGWSETFPGGIIYCTTICVKDLFPCIVEDIKKLFDIPRRGIHRIIINGCEYILYYVPISTHGEIIWETPLNRLDNKHPLRVDPKFRREVQKVIAFCDILALCGTGESTIRIRPGADHQYIPITINEKTTSIMKNADYDYSILSKTLFSKWFGEKTCISDVVKEMVHYHSNHDLARLEYSPERNIPITQSSLGISDNLTVLSVEMRGKIDNIIRKYDGNYIWYSNFIVDRMSRYLLSDTNI